MHGDYDIKVEQVCFITSFRSISSICFKHRIKNLCFRFNSWLLRRNSMISTWWLTPMEPALLTCRLSEMVPRWSGEIQEDTQGTEPLFLSDVASSLLCSHSSGPSSLTLSWFVNMPSVWPKMKIFATWLLVSSMGVYQASTPWSPSTTYATSRGR